MLLRMALEIFISENSHWIFSDRVLTLGNRNDGKYKCGQGKLLYVMQARAARWRRETEFDN